MGGSDGLHTQDEANGLSSLTNQELCTERTTRNGPLSTSCSRRRRHAVGSQLRA